MNVCGISKQIQMKLCPNEWKKLRTEDKMGTEDHLISVSALDKVTFYAVFELW